MCTFRAEVIPPSADHNAVWLSYSNYYIAPNIWVVQLTMQTLSSINLLSLNEPNWGSFYRETQLSVI